MAIDGSSHGRRGLSRLLLGSQAHNIITHSSICR
jgi:nucleotide-binding universal stress UspA family protein